MRAVHTLTVSTHGCKSAGLPQPYFVAVLVWPVAAHHPMHPPIHLPAVVDDFGDLVIVGRTL